LWTGVLALTAVGLLATIAVRLVHRQSSLARLKNSLAAMVSHELKTPLASMRVLTDTLLSCQQLDEKRVREYLQLISRENERLSRLIHNFLAFARIERKRDTFKFDLVPVAPMIEAAIEAMGERLQAPACCLEVQIDPDLPLIRADADAITMALVNLLDNACKYSDEPKRIQVRARAQDSQVLLTVRDNGIGIARHNAQKVFRSFYQVDRRLSRKEGGCGLGLSIVASIAAAHRGRASLQSEPGCGSTFTISVPAAAAEMATTAEVWA
jgi:signal transduction histidine kinase